MSTNVLIIGGSGTGKSTSIRNLNPAETFIISVLDKPLPFRGFKTKYKPLKGWDDKEGNYYCTDDWSKVIKCISVVNRRPEINSIVLDDFGYLMSSEFIKRCGERGYDKYSEMASHIFLIIKEIMSLREDLFCFVFAHNEADNTGFMKIKTIGKMLDEKLCIEGMFTTVLHSQLIDDEYKFLTQHNGTHLAKSPYGLFPDKYIDNDLAFIRKKMVEYFNGDIPL